MPRTLVSRRRFCNTNSLAALIPHPKFVSIEIVFIHFVQAWIYVFLGRWMRNLLRLCVFKAFLITEKSTIKQAKTLHICKIEEVYIQIMKLFVSTNVLRYQKFWFKMNSEAFKCFKAKQQQLCFINQKTSILFSAIWNHFRKWTKRGPGSELRVNSFC